MPVEGKRSTMYQVERAKKVDLSIRGFFLQVKPFFFQMERAKKGDSLLRGILSNKIPKGGGAMEKGAKRRKYSLELKQEAIT